jgi:hypothetical protein
MANATSIATLGMMGKTANRSETIATLGMITSEISSLSLQQWQTFLLEQFAFDYAVFAGITADDYPDDFTMFNLERGYKSRIIMAIFHDNPCDLIFTYDGVTEQPAREFSQGFIKFESAIGFKIKSATPGMPCQYQIVPML